MRARGSAKESPLEAPVVAFYNTTPPFIEVELRRRYSYYIYEIARLKKRRKRGIKVNICKDVEPAAKALVVSELMAIFHPGDRKS